MVSTRITIHDIEDLPITEGNRYEIIDGQFCVQTQPHSNDQVVTSNLLYKIGLWTRRLDNGVTMLAPSVLFDDENVVAPDLIWMSKARHIEIFNEDGKLYGAPELVVEILSPGSANENGDRNLKYKLYSRRGVSEYWIVDWRKRQIEVFRRNPATLSLEPAATAFETDTIQSPNLPGFSCTLTDVFGKVISI